jgi:hypothetical protein
MFPKILDPNISYSINVLLLMTIIQENGNAMEKVNNIKD